MQNGYFSDRQRLRNSPTTTSSNVDDDSLSAAMSQTPHDPMVTDNTEENSVQNPPGKSQLTEKAISSASGPTEIPSDDRKRVSSNSFACPRQPNRRDLSQAQMVTRFSPETIQVIAQSNPAFPRLSDDAAAALAPDAGYRIREIVQDSIKFMRHSKRRKLTTDDVNSALRLQNMDPLYGFGHFQSGVVRLSSNTTNVASSTNAPGPQNSGPSAELHDLHGAHNGEPLSDSREGKSQFTRADGISDLFFVEDAEMNVKNLITSHLPPVPVDYSVTMHWLAIDGVQPAIPQNPVTNHEALAKDANSVDGLFSSKENIGNLDRALRNPQVKPRVRHVIGKELQLYYDHVTKTVAHGSVLQRDACIQSLMEEPGLVQLLPYFTLHIRENVQRSLKNLPLLFSLMRMAHALLVNPHFELENYLHQLLPPILTCLVGRRLSNNSHENHWALRNFSAELVAQICTRYGSTYSTIQPRITKTLKEAFLDTKRPLTTHYGALVGLGALGVHVVDLLIMPHMREYGELVLRVLDNSSAASKGTRSLEAAKVYGALAWVARISLTKAETAVLQSDASTMYSFSEDEIASVLPEYDKRISGLQETHGENLFPRSVIESASAVGVQLLESSASASKTDPSGSEDAVRQNGNL